MSIIYKNFSQESKKDYIMIEKETIMLETLFWLALGAFIGWNFPQPEFAKNLQEKFVSFFRK